jgi:esterase/lipase superfamily enzyme
MPRIRLIFWIALTVMLAGCAARPATNTYAVGSAGETRSVVASGPVLESLFVATTRARSSVPPDLFSGERGVGVDYARVTVSIPPVHQPGALELPRYGEAKSGLHFTLPEQRYVDSEADYVRSVNDNLASRSPEDRNILLFVHGYNTGFRDSVLRFSQFAYDSGFSGPRVLFTWASRGSTLEYFYDKESATIARDGLEQTLRILAGTNVNKIHIMAHSMGNWVAMEALRQLQISGNATLGGKIGEIVLASPDIDFDVFKAQMRRLGKPAKPYNLILSRDDRALNLSAYLSGNQPRLGNYTDDSQVTDLGIIVYDVTSVESGDKLRHGKFAQAPEIVQLLGQRLKGGTNLSNDKVRFSDRLQTLGRNLGGVVAATGDIVISAPATVLTRPDEILTAPGEIIVDAAKRNRCKNCTAGSN